LVDWKEFGRKISWPNGRIFSELLQKDRGKAMGLFPGRDSNRIPPEFKSRAVSLSNVIHITITVITIVMTSEFLYDWRYTANQFVLAPSPLRPTTRDFFN
jgi:hypothetical protein